MAHARQYGAMSGKVEKEGEKAAIVKKKQVENMLSSTFLSLSMCVLEIIDNVIKIVISPSRGPTGYADANSRIFRRAEIMLLVGGTATTIRRDIVRFRDVENSPGTYTRVYTYTRVQTQIYNTHKRHTYACREHEENAREKFCIPP